MSVNPNDIQLNFGRDALIPDMGKATLSDRYYYGTERSPQQSFARAAAAFATDLAHAQRMYNYASMLWFGFSTPILSNGGTDRGHPISCFLNDVPDSRKGLSSHYDENIWLASAGGGIGGNWSQVRSDGERTANGSKSTGSIPFMHVVDSQMLAFNQGTTRRGSYAAYMDVSHPEIEEFVNMRKPTGGDIHRKCLNLHHGVNIPDSFMELIQKKMEDEDYDDSWSLKDPHSGHVVKTVSASALWMQIIETRMQTGEPFIHFIDRSNEFLPDAQKKLGLKVQHSNLCSEITLPTNKTRTAVCCLSSVNAAKFDEWSKDDQFIPDLVEYLDNVIEHFIKEGGKKEGYDKAVYSAFRERSIGIGVMGFHTYLQQKRIPFESPMASGQNRRIIDRLKTEAEKASEALAKIRGEAPDMKGTGRRNAHLLAIAPNASSSIICGGVSPSIEPIRANVYTHKTMSGSFVIRNPELAKVIREEAKKRKLRCGRELRAWEEAQWKIILQDKGSVAGLDWMDDYLKDVFKTAIEIDPLWIVDHAAVRQFWICQAQSLNLFFRGDEWIPTLHHIHFMAWKRGLKSLYYCRSEAVHRAEDISTKIARHKLVADTSECLSCEG